MLRRNSTKEKPAKVPKEKAPKPVKEKKVKISKAPKVKVAKTPVVKVKRKTDIYTLMLLVAFLAVLTACVMLYLDLASYGTNRKPSGVRNTEVTVVTTQTIV
ncbi:MAG: hypothetical protein LBQ54_10030 [Planctomycetaceae bacterium]|jgi:hypothetical protein|nr:hypothetical protein [Planctomycetaceae bacterium]